MRLKNRRKKLTRAGWLVFGFFLFMGFISRPEFLTFVKICERLVEEGGRWVFHTEYFTGDEDEQPKSWFESLGRVCVGPNPKAIADLSDCVQVIVTRADGSLEVYHGH